MRLNDGQIAEVKQRVDIADVAGRLGIALRRSGRKMVGPCPFCGGSKLSARFELKGERWVCAVCCDGGDAIKLVGKVIGLDFRGAVDWLGGPREIDEKTAKRLAAERAERDARQAADLAAHERAERARAEAIWRGGAPARPGDMLERYFARRGLERPEPSRLRLAPDAPYWHDGKVIHRGPAMLAAIIGNDGYGQGVHQTWLDLDMPKGKARIVDPATGEILSSKKSRGSTAAGHIELIRQPRPRRLFLAEGIETDTAIYCALRWRGKMREGDAFWTSVDLGNLGGPALETVAHPTLKNEKGAALRLPGPKPDFGAPAIALPDSLEELITLGDGDSEPVLTRFSHQRARARYRRPGLIARTIFAEAGQDFDDMARASEEARA